MTSVSLGAALAAVAYQAKSDQLDAEAQRIAATQPGNPPGASWRRTLRDTYRHRAAWLIERGAPGFWEPLDRRLP